jgi:hypothetical protein
MQPSPSPYRPAWLPLTPRGVAGFAGASLRRVLAVQLLLAAALAVLAVATVQDTWFADVRRLIGELPAEGAIRGGRLDWTNPVPVRLLEDRYLAVAVDPEQSGVLGQEADLTILLSRTNALCASVLGYAAVPYPTDYTISLRRDDVAAWWGAREPFLVLGVGAASGLFWLLAWWLLASVYWVAAWIVGLAGNRDLPPAAAWKLAAAAQLPGVLLFATALASYRFGWLNLLRLGYGFALSFAVAWCYVFVSPMLVPKAASRAPKQNPFTGQGAADSPEAAKRGGNPFAR